MDDKKEAVDDAQDGAAATAPDELKAQSVENKESRDVEVDNEAEHGNGENCVKSASEVAEHFPASGNRELQEEGQVLLHEEKVPYSVDANAKDPGSDSVVLASTLSDVEAEDEKREEESNDGVPEVLSSAENGSGEEELHNDFTHWRDVKNEEGMEYKVKEVEITAKNCKEEVSGVLTNAELQSPSQMEEPRKPQLNGAREAEVGTPSLSFLLDANDVTGNESGTEEEQAAFMQELETFYRERCLDFKAPKFYQEPLNCLKLWRAVIRLGGYEQVTSLKLWRQVGESFRPPKTCTTVSWTFRGFYEKALLEYEKHKMRSGELPFTDASLSDPVSGNQADLIHAPGSGRARRDAAARAMQGWHSQRLLGNGEVGDSIIKDKNPVTSPKREKHLRNIGFLKRKASSPVEHAVKVARLTSKQQLEIMVVDVGVPADWVKVNVQRTKDCYEVYALVPGLLREEVRVQSDPAGRLVISGQPEQQDNPWGVTPFKKVVSLPTRIDPHQTSAVVTLHGQLFVRVPFEQSDV